MTPKEKQAEALRKALAARLGTTPKKPDQKTAPAR